MSHHRSSESFELDRDDAFTEDPSYHPGGARSDVEDYSSDSSDENRPSYGASTEESQPHAAAHRGRGGRTAGGEQARLPRDVAYPVDYRFTETTSEEAVQSESVSLNDERRLGFKALGGLVKYSSSDLLTRAWCLCRPELKRREFPLFSKLPKCPEILETRFCNTEEVSRFMCATALQLGERYQRVTPVYLRSLLVQAIVREEVSNVGQGASNNAPYTDSLLNPSWGNDTRLAEDADEVSDGEDANEEQEEVTDVEQTVSAFDFSVALALPVVSQGISYESLQLLHVLVDRCIGRTSDSGVLHSWGVKRIMLVLLRQMEAGVGQSVNRKWLSAAISLLSKIAFTSGDTRVFLALLRWSLLHGEALSTLHMRGLRRIVESVELTSTSRVPLSIPTEMSVEQSVSLVHLLGGTPGSITGLCVLSGGDAEARQCVVFTETRAYKIALNPPFEVLCTSSTAPESCRGVYMEKDKSVCVVGENGKVFVINHDTLILTRTITPPAHLLSSMHWPLYIGENNYVAPFFLTGAIMNKQLCFTGDEVSGSLTPGSVTLPRTCDSLSIQFFLCPIVNGTASEVVIVQLTAGNKNWLTVTVTVNPTHSTMVIAFRHGQDAVAEVQEAVRPEWTLWSASLTSSNDTASWSVFRNGVTCDCRAQSGALVQPNGSVTPTFFKGRLHAHFSTLQLWSRVQSMDVMRSCAVEQTPESKSQFLIFSFLMDEGLGCTLHSPQTGYVWQGSGLRWDAPTKPFTVKRHTQRRVYWRPTGPYYVVTNHFEYAIIEPHMTTWMDRDGRVMEQGESILAVNECPFYDVHEGRFFLSTQDSVGIHSVKSNSPPAAYLRHLPSLLAGKHFCSHVVERVMSGTSITAEQYLEYLVYRTNSRLLTCCGAQVCGAITVSSNPRSNLVVVGRLLDLVEHLVSGIERGSKECLQPELLLCFFGRVLNFHVKLFERQCPGQVVCSVVDTHKRFQGLMAMVKQNDLFEEASTVFGELNATVLARCVSYDFQLRLITESSSLKDVSQLLLPENLPQFVASVIEKDMKKMFMTFLHRLKEACQEEALQILNDRPRSMAASEAMLSTLLSMLSQQAFTQWHLVAAALISSLCKWITRCFEERYPSEAERLVSVDVLKETSIGIVLFPVVHYMCDIHLDASIASDALQALNEASKCLLPYSSVHNKSTRELVSFTETHYVVSPPQQTAPFTANLSLQYAKSIRIEFADSPEYDRATSTVTVSAITNTCQVLVKSLRPGEHEFFQEGAHLSVVMAPDATAEMPSPSLALSVQTVVELATEKTTWVRDICLALSTIIIRVTQHNLYNTAPSGYSIGKDSFLRGGLSPDVQKANRIAAVSGERQEYADLHAQLCAVAQGKDSSLTSMWSTLYQKCGIQYAQRLELIMRWSSCALAWHTLSPMAVDDVVLEDLLLGSVKAIKRKTFLLLEALQQGREEAIVERARFLLMNIMPRVFGESHVSDYQHTEEPVTAHVDRGSRQLSRIGPSIGNRSRAAVAGSEALTTHMLDVSRSYRGSHLSTQRTTSRTAETSPVSIFRKALRSEEDSLPNKIIYYLINGLENSTRAIESDLVVKTRQAVYQTVAYKLQQDLCKLFMNDHAMLSAILVTHLKYRLQVSQSTHSGISEGAEAGTDQKMGFAYHYAEPIVGCGMLRELELQKSVSTFVRTALHALLPKLDDVEKFPYEEAVYMCATLCHPWDGVDLSILQPRDIFAFLKKLFAAVCTLRLESPGNGAEKYFESRGLFELAHRCLVIPNAMLQTSVDGVHVTQSEVQGLHVENVNVVFCARTHWKAHGASVKMPAKTDEIDHYSNFGIPGVISEFPDVQYFELTLDFALHPDHPELSMGLSFVPLSLLDPVRSDYVLSLSSSGRVHCPEKQDYSLCPPWKVGDVVGCGLMAPSDSVFFTLNGTFLGVVADISTLSTAIPFVNVQGDDTLMKVIVNFGEEQPFQFDLASLHCSCRHRYLTSTTMCDTVIITLDYLVTMCYRSLAEEEGMSTANREAVSLLLERAAAFLNSSSTALMVKLNACAPGQNGRIEPIVVLLSRLLHCVAIVVECFRYNSVTPSTHAATLHVCAALLTRSRDKWVKVRASQCLTALCRILRPDYLAEASNALRSLVSCEDIVQQLDELARVRLLKDVEAPMQPPRWVGDTTVVKGKGAFFGSAPLPKKGTHIVGFRIKRRQHQVQGSGAPLGGCYYLGLAHGQPSIPNMGNLISRSDVYVLQDTDDQDQVAHLLLRRHCIPRNNHRRIYGNDEVVWVEFNADYGEISFYRENMVPIGLAFANLSQVDNLYPIAFLFNDDASCDIIAPPSVSDESMERWSESLRRSVAINTLQELHMVSDFSTTISLMVQRSISLLDRDLDACLVALGVLGGERSYLYCQHDTYGMIVVHAIAEVTGKVVVHLASDEDKRLFPVSPHGLKPCFIQTPLYQSNTTDAHACATLLSNELYRIIYEASVVAPLLGKEEAARREVERQRRESLSGATAMTLIGILTEQRLESQRPGLRRGSTGASEVRNSFFPFRCSDSGVVFSNQTVAVDLHCSTKTLYVPIPSVAVTTAEGCSVVRGNVQLDLSFTLAVSITQSSPNDLIYVGFTTTCMRWPESQDEVASWDDAWVLCNRDSAATNSINCCMEPGIIFGAAEKLFQSGDVLLMLVDRRERTMAFTRIRGSEQTHLGVLFEGIPAEADLRPVVVCGEETVVVFSTLHSLSFPARVTYPVSNFDCPSRERVTCSSCSRRLTPPWYGGEDGVTLCESCFVSWKRPKDMFFVASTAARAAPEYIVSNHCPETLICGEYVEFEENSTVRWSESRSVNAEMLDSTCLANNDECFAFTDELPQFGQRRVDVRLGHTTGVAGHPFSGLHSFTPLWRDGQQTRAAFHLRGDTVAVSITLLPMRTKTFVCLHISSDAHNVLFAMTDVFVGVTNLADASRPMSRTDLDHLCAAKNVWGAWCDTRDKVNSSGDVYLLVDCLNNAILISSSLSGLQRKPFIITGGISADAEEDNLRLLVFSHDPCVVNSREGQVSYNDAAEPSFAPVAIGLFPDTDDVPSVDTFSEAVVLMDTVDRTQEYTKTGWRYSPHAEKLDNGTLFHIGDTITFFNDGEVLRVYVQGIEMASLEVSGALRTARLRVVAYLSTRGTTATLVPPLYGTTHLGKIIRVCGPEVAIVEGVSESGASNTYAIHRSAVRFCALAVSLKGERLDLQEGDPLAFKIGRLQTSKRGTVASVQGNIVNVCESSDKRDLLTINASHCFLLRNEGKRRCNYSPYPLISPPTSCIIRVFEVGKKKFRLQSRSSYNGIMFDCKTSETIELMALSVLTRVSGCHQVHTYFRKGSSVNYERDARSWNIIFDGMVDMNADHQFNIPFAPILIEGGTTFALYINTSHNFGIGFYCEEDGCSGSIGQELDSDGTLSVCLGRKSGSSDPFAELSMSPRGFCGAIQYKQNQGSSLPSIEGKQILAPTTNTAYRHCSDAQRLICRPLTTTKDTNITFGVRVVSLAVRLISFQIPVLLVNPQVLAPQGISHCCISMFMRQGSDAEWHWIWNSRFLVEGDLSEVSLCPSNLCLEPGMYTFRVLLKNIESEGAGTPPHLYLLSSSEPSHTRGNGLITVHDFFGDITCEANTPVLEGELHTMITGVHLNQSNSASYNGIMFDLRSKKEITLEEIFCISQTTSDRVTVRIFWKEGSMEGAEKTPHHWREVANKEVTVVDKHPFSVGPLMLRMRANQVCSIYINTTSSCGVRFYNSSDGHVGNIRDEFDSDGLLSVYVGRKSESSTPFVELPLEPRAFRGRITYRTYALQSSEEAECAIFPYVRCFLVTRMLVALMSYVELSGQGSSANFSYPQLLKTISLLATSPVETSTDLVGAENILTSLIRGSNDVCSTANFATVPIAKKASSVIVPLAKGDVALLAATLGTDSSAVVQLISHVQPNGTADVCSQDATAPFRVPARRLLPIIKCVSCGDFYALGKCAVTNSEHTPVVSEDARAAEMIANGLRVVRPEMSVREAIDHALLTVGSAWCGDRPATLSNAAAPANTAVLTKLTARGVGFFIPEALLLREEEYNESGGLFCPFVFHPTAEAAVSLRISTSSSAFAVQFITSSALTPRAQSSICTASPQFLQLRLFGGEEDSLEALMEEPVSFVVSSGGESSVSLIESIHAGFAASLQRSGIVPLFLEIKSVASLPFTVASLPIANSWTWDSNSVEAQLCPTATTYLAHVFSAEESTANWPHSSTFMVTAKGKGQSTIFLELHVAEMQRRTLSASAGMMSRAAPTALPVRIRKPFHVQSDELLTLRFTSEGDFFVYDTNDIVRCSLSKEELYSGRQQRQLHRIGFVCVDPEKVTAFLYVPEKIRRNPRAVIPLDAKTVVTSPALQPKTYTPMWIKLDATRVTVSRNGLTASSINELGGGDAVMGTPLPATGVSSFVVHIHRKDSLPGSPLGSGFFAGVALSDFAQLTPEYSALKTCPGSLWVVQDVQDIDSMPNQERLPSLMRDANGHEVLFCDSTKLVFIVDRSNGALSISRDNESPQVVFQGIPRGASVSPFVRLDHPNSSATLARFSSAVEYARLHQPSLEKLLRSQPITPSLLRRYPLFMVSQTFPFVSELVSNLPTRLAGVLERQWGEQTPRTRFDYRVSQALEELTQIGAFARSAAPLSPSKISSIVDYLTRSSHREIVVFASVREAPLDASMSSTASAGVHFRLPPNYELVGPVEGTSMFRVLYFDQEFGALERTLHLFYVNDALLNLHSVNNVLPHSSVMRQHELLPALDQPEGLGIMTDGWFDGTLADITHELDVKAQQEIASSLVYALEHWHLHQLPHGHVHPKNVYLRIAYGKVVQCNLWNVHQLLPSSPYASHELREAGIRSLYGDRWGCWRILHSFETLLAQDPSVAECVEHLVDESISLSKVLQLSNAFQDSFSDAGEGPSFSLRTGSRLRGGSGSYNGIMFDVVAKNNTIRITKLSFIPDTNTVATVRLYTRNGSFMGFERDAEAWVKLVEEELTLKDSWEVTLENFEPITVPAGARVGIFLHTTSGSGVLFFSENEGLQGKTGDVEEENDDIGITIGKKSESANPFVAVQSQKRLLKGSITYTVLMRSNGPRSRLIYSAEPTTNDTKDEEPLMLRFLQLGESCRTASLDNQGALDTTSSDGDAREETTAVAEDLSRCCLQIVGAETAHRKGSDREEILTLVAPNRFEWCSALGAVAVRSESVSEWARPLMSCLEASGVRRRRFLLSQHNRGTRVFPCRPLHFRSMSKDDAQDVAAASAVSVTHPVLTSGGVFVSEALTTSCTLSLWTTSKGSMSLSITDHEPSLDDVHSFTSETTSFLMSGRSRGCFLHVDEELRCVTSPQGNVHLLLRDILKRRPLYVVARMDRAGDHSLKLFAYSNSVDTNTFVPVTDGCFFRAPRERAAPDNDDSHPVTWRASGGFLALEGNTGLNSSDAQSNIRVESILAGNWDVRVVRVPQSCEETEKVTVGRVCGVDSLLTMTVSPSTPDVPQLFELREEVKWKPMRQSVDFTCVSPSLAPYGPFGAQQVTGGTNCCGVVSAPHITLTQRHRILLRLQFPRSSPVELRLDCKGGSASPTRLLHGSYDSLRSRLFDPAVREVFVYVDIHLQSREIVVVSTDGTVYHPIMDESVLSSDVKLGYTFHAPGSFLEVLEWNVTTPQMRGEMSSIAVRGALEKVGVDRISANTSLTVGTVCRHSARGSHMQSQDSGFPVEKQMEILMVAYARMLLEKTLVSQQKARTAAQPQFLRLLSFTSLGANADIARILDSEIKLGSFRLVSQCVAHLSAPFLLQSLPEIDMSIKIIESLMRNDTFRRAIENPFGSTIILILLRAATAYTRGTRHAALRCVQELLADDKIPLPSHQVLSAHLRPLTDMMASLCRCERMGSAVVQTGVLLISDLVERYQRERPAQMIYDAPPEIPYKLVLCTREIVRALTHDPPLPLPSTIVGEVNSSHVMTCDIVKRTADAENRISACGVFREENRDPEGSMSFVVKLNGNRRGSVTIGWNASTPESPLEKPLPCFGYFVEARTGAVFLCYRHVKQPKALTLRVNAGDDLVTTADYRDHKIHLELKRAGITVGETTFDSTREIVGLPFFYAENSEDATVDLKSLLPGAQALSLSRLCEQILHPPYECDAVPPQSYEFYAELNHFLQTVLKVRSSGDLISRVTKECTVASHELASYTLVSSVLNAGAFADAVSLSPLVPYAVRLRRIDELTAEFAPLINLRRRTELFHIFGVLKNLCSRETEEQIQTRIMKPFQHRQGKKVSVTIHAMQAQPTSSSGAFPTLMRSVFGQLYLQLQQATIDTFYVSPIFTVKLAGFGSTDAGGPYRDVLSQLATEIMTSHPNRQCQLNPLFVNCGRGDATAIMPNVSLMKSAQTPLMLEFFGKILASFFLTQDLLAVELPPLFWKLLLSEETTIRDLATLDSDITKLLQAEELMMRSQEELEERFPGISLMWKQIVDDHQQFLLEESLPPETVDGARLLSQRIVASEIRRFEDAIGYIQQGFDQVLPLYTLQAFRWQKVELLICGTPKLTFTDFRNECDIQLSSADASMFLSVLEAMTDEDRTSLLRFATGQSRLPLKTKIKVTHNGNKETLPTSSTCFFALRLPSYSSAEKMKERLLYAVRQCKAIDADGQAREHLIID